jgi:hypothetical protein
MEDVSEGKRNDVISKRELERLLWTNQKEIEDLVGVPLTKGDVDNVLEKADANDLLDMFNAKTLKKESPVAYNAIRFGISTGMVIVLCIITLLCIFLLLKINRWNILYTCGDVGVVLAVIGGLYLIVTAFTTLLSGLWYDLVGTIIGSVTANIIASSLMTTCVICVLAVLLILTKVIGKKLLSKQ